MEFFEKTSVQMAKYLGLSNSTLILILARAEFNRFKKGRFYVITKGFIDDLYNLFELKRRDSKKFEQKYKIAQTKLLQWRRSLSKKEETKNAV